MKRIVLHIDSLVLKGFRPEDRHAIGDGLQQELSRLLTNPLAVQGITHLGNQSQLRASRIPLLAQSAKPQTVGAQVAQSISKEFTK